MSRRRRTRKTEVISDVKYSSPKIAKFIHMIMKWGQKSIAEKIVYQALDKASQLSQMPPVEFFEKVMDTVAPKVELKSKRIGGATYQIPVDVSPERRLTLALRLLIKYSRARSEKTMIDKLSGEMVDAAANRGGSVKERDNIHKMADANKAFAHLRFAA